MVDKVPFTGLIAGDNSVLYPANSVVLTGTGGNVLVNSNLSIDGSGFVGVGTTVPLARLDVRGGLGVTAASNFGSSITVASLVSNGAVSGTTITGTAATLTSSQNSGLERAANIVSNTWIHATQNLTVASATLSTSTTTGAAVVTGGVGVGGNINVGGTRNLFTGFVGVGTSAILGANSNVFSVYGTAMVFGNIDLGNTTSGTSGIYFADGTFQTTASSGAAITIADDTTTNATRYVSFVSSISGTATTLNVSSTKLYFNPSTGTLNATVFNSLSDRELKTDIVPISSPFDKISAITGVGFKWKEHGTRSYGVIAQELAAILPELVSDTDPKTVNYSGLIAFLIECVKDLDQRLKAIETRD